MSNRARDPSNPTSPIVLPEVNAILDRFEQAWERDERPAIEAHLPTDKTLYNVVLPHLVHMDLDYRYRKGETVLVEEYLVRFPALADSSTELVELILSECALRRLRSAMDVEAVLLRFPSLREVLARRLPTALASVGLSDCGPGASLSAMPTVLGRYRIEKFVGEGSMGVVYLAHDSHLERSVALKVPCRVGRGSRGLQRFLREARAAAHLNHPNICPIYDAGEIDDLPFISMAFIHGKPLTSAFPPPLDPAKAVQIVRQLALALHWAHLQHMIHRDLKPANILVNEREEPIITDFGLARRSRPGEITGTMPGQILGTPAYMPPEQALGMVEAMGPRSDVYSLGVILYELLTGARPFEGQTYQEVLARVVHEEPACPTRLKLNLDPILGAICLLALRKRPEQRHESMKVFAEALEKWLKNQDPRGPLPEASDPARTIAADPRLAAGILQALRDCAWDISAGRLKDQIREQTDFNKRAVLQVLLGFLAGERGLNTDALEQLQAAEGAGGLAGWALAGQALVALRERKFAEAMALLARAAPLVDPGDSILDGTLAHVRGTLLLHQGRGDESLPLLHKALDRLGPHHFGSGRVLDTLGMLHAARGCLALAERCFLQSLTVKQSFGDEAGVALAHGQLGRLFLDSEELDRAETHFKQGLVLSQQIGDPRGEAQLYNHRAQVLLARGRAEESLPLLDEAVRGASNRWDVIEGYARKDRARAYLDLGRLPEAEQDLDQAEALFQGRRFVEGVDHCLRVRGRLRQIQGRTDEALQALQTAAIHFENRREDAEAARTHWERGRALRSKGAGTAQVAAAFLTALDHAERSRRGRLIAGVEQELEAFAGPEMLRRRLARLGGGEKGERRLVGTVLALHWRLDDAIMLEDMAVLHDLDAEIAALLRKHEIVLCQYTGAGLLALVETADHARRAVTAALEVTRYLKEVNSPHAVLSLPLWRLQIGVSSGTVWMGVRGDFHKRDRTLFGQPVREASELALAASPEGPWISAATRAVVGPEFRLTQGTPATWASTEASHQPGWEVVGSKS
jgi:tetratricopeptide (TPR) repeat protein/predicted Ser/Thr protein kinase